MPKAYAKKALPFTRYYWNTHTHIQLITLVYRIEFSVVNILKLEFVVYRFSVMGTQLSQEYREW